MLWVKFQSRLYFIHLFIAYSGLRSPVGGPALENIKVLFFRCDMNIYNSVWIGLSVLLLFYNSLYGFLVYSYSAAHIRTVLDKQPCCFDQRLTAIYICMHAHTGKTALLFLPYNMMLVDYTECSW